MEGRPEGSGDVYQPLERLFHLAREGEDLLRRAASVLARGPQSPALDDLAGDLAGVAGAWQDWHADLRFLTDPRAGKHVYWRSGGKPESAAIVAAPVEVAEIVRGKLLPDLTSVVFASATLATAGSFRYVRERLGLAEGAELEVTERVYPSPFDFPRQLGAFVLDPRAARGAWPDDSAEAVADDPVVPSVGPPHRPPGRDRPGPVTPAPQARRARKRPTGAGYRARRLAPSPPRPFSRSGSSPSSSGRARRSSVSGSFAGGRWPARTGSG